MSTPTRPNSRLQAVDRLRMLMYLSRHAIGAALFLWVTILSIRVGERGFTLIMIVLDIAYIGFAVWTSVRIVRRYQARYGKAKSGEGQ